MRFARTNVVLSLCLVLALSVSGQQTATPSPQALSLLQRSLAALTGGQSTTDVTLSGTARRIAGSDDETGTAVVKGLATGETRIDLSFPSGQHSEVRTRQANDDPMGQWTGPDGTPHAISYHNLLLDSACFFPEHFLRKIISTKSNIVSHLGTETREHHLVEHLVVSRDVSNVGGDGAKTIQHLSEMGIFLNASTLLLETVTLNMHPDDDANIDIPMEFQFSDYRPLNGASVPYHVQKYLNNGLVLDLQFESVASNRGLSKSDFQVQGSPKGDLR